MIFLQDLGLLSNRLFDPDFLSHHLLFCPLAGYISALFPKHFISFRVSEPLHMLFIWPRMASPKFFGKLQILGEDPILMSPVFFLDLPKPMSHPHLCPHPFLKNRTLFQYSTHCTAITYLLISVHCYILWTPLGRNRVSLGFGALCLAKGLTHRRHSVDVC